MTVQGFFVEAFWNCGTAERWKRRRKKDGLTVWRGATVPWQRSGSKPDRKVTVTRVFGKAVRHAAGLRGKQCHLLGDFVKTRNYLDGS